MVGDAASRDTHPIGLVVNAGIAAAVVALYLLRAQRRADRFDLLILAAVCLFAVGAIFSEYPRQSFDSVLGMLAAAAALFFLRDVMTRSVTRRLMLVAFMSLSAVLTIITALKWLLPWLQWWSLTDWTLVPPLGMNFSAEPWGHRHDVALLLAMLYPAWWMGQRSPLRAGAAILIGAVDIVLIVIGGSRMVWLAILGAGAIVLAPSAVRAIGLHKRHDMALGATALLLVIGAVAIGMTGPVAERLLGGASLAERTAMWGPLVGAWSERPFVGSGLGSFPWILQGTGYFDTYSFSPRHPDSAIVQQLAEGGLVGVMAMAIVVGSTAWQMTRSRSRAATWAIAAFAIAALAGNPTDFDFMVVVTVAWLAYACPHQPTAAGMTTAVRRSALGYLMVGAAIVVGIAYAATVGSAVAYSVARARVSEGDLPAASAALRLAATMDPGLALYPRQLGTIALLEGDPGPAVAYLEAAVKLNPADDLAWRTLAIAYDEAGRRLDSAAAIDMAIRDQRSDPANMLLALRAQQRGGDYVATRALAAEIVQAWPAIVASPGWHELAGNEMAPDDVARSAGARWDQHLSSPEPLFAQPLMLRALTGLPGPPTADESRFSLPLAGAYLSAMRCDTDAGDRLRRTSDQDRRQATYWALSRRVAQLEGLDGGRYARMYTTMTGDPILEAEDEPALGPFDENGSRGSSADRWGYRRPAIDWPPSRFDLPSPREGFALWHLDPHAAAAAAATEGVRACR
jgi:O-antigen ligase/tetratricopeptide (TPR) repeat protein